MRLLPLAISSLLLLAACGGEEEPTPADRGAEPPANTGAPNAPAPQTGAPGGVDPLAVVKAELEAVKSGASTDPAAAAQRFLAFADGAPTSLPADTWHRAAHNFFEAGAAAQALEVIDAGLLQHPDAAALTQARYQVVERLDQLGDE